MIFLSGIVYVIWSSLLLKKHKEKIRDRFSDLGDINLKWLQFLTYGLGLIWALVIFTRNDTIIFLGVSAFVILVGFFGVQQKSIFKTNEQSIRVKSGNRKKYAKSGLSDNASHNLFQALEKLIEDKSVYKQAELSIGNLADMLDIHPNY